MKLSAPFKIACMGMFSALFLCCNTSDSPGGANLTGNWKWISTVEAVTGTGCPMKVRDSLQDTVSFLQTSATAVGVSGLGDSSNVLGATLGASTGGGSIAELHIQGMYPRYSGRVSIDTATSSLSVESGSKLMSGEEDWTWTHGGTTCSGVSVITATRM